MDGKLSTDLSLKLHHILKPNGRILLMQSTLANVEETISKFGERQS